MDERIKIYYNSETENYDIAYTDLIIKQGNTHNIYLEFVNEDDVAIDITDFVIFFTVKNNATESDIEAAIKKDITEHESAAGGISKIVIEPTDTDIESGTDLLGNYIYDVKIKDADENIFTVVEGTITIAKGITQRTEEE